ncbi:MAG: hypothetical protein ACI9C4_001490, partial [Paraglaciecola sp.]
SWRWVSRIIAWLNSGSKSAIFMSRDNISFPRKSLYTLDFATHGTWLHVCAATMVLHKCWVGTRAI